MKFTKVVKADNEEKITEMEDLLLQVQKGLETAEYAASLLKDWIPVIHFEMLKKNIQDALNDVYYKQRFLKDNKNNL